MKIKRDLLNELIKWKNSARRLPLILKGVRQCGKTWLLKEFGKIHFDKTVYLNFDRDSKIAGFFENTFDTKRILENISAYTGVDITPQNTLIIFDEIQKSSKALNSLKYFAEEASEYCLASAGSLLGISLGAKEGFPVGKVDFLNLYPCSFGEYLTTVAPNLRDYIAKKAHESILEIFALELERCLKEYLSIGGMPAVVSCFAETKSFEECENILQNVIEAYEADFSRHAEINIIPKIRLLWKSIPLQLARENAKFFYGEVKTGARAKDLEDALQWLLNAGLIYKINNIKTPAIPMTAYCDRRAFKLYLADVGVLRKLSGLTAGHVFSHGDIFGEFKGRLTENYVLQQLKSLKIDPICYWTSSSGKAEVDFLIQGETDVIPIEVKSGLSTKSQSLKSYRNQYKPELSVRTSLQNLKYDNGLLNIPLYLLPEFNVLINEAY